MNAHQSPPHPDVRVLSVIHPFRPAFSGEGEWWLRAIPGLRERGVDVQILTTAEANGHPAVEHTELVDGVVVHRVPTAGGLPPYPGRLVSLLRTLHASRRRFDLVVFHSLNHDGVFASCVAGRALGWKTVFKMTLYGADDLQTVRRTGRFGRVRFASLALADGLISLGPGMAGPYRDQPSVRDRLLIVAQGVDVRRFAPPSQAERVRLRRGLGITDDRPVALFCGGLVRRKGVDTLIEAWAEVHRHLPEAVLLLVGPHHLDGLDEPYFREFSEFVHQRIPALGLQDHVRLLGLRRDVDRIYGAADLFVFPSRAEGWAAVFGEAMASGLPCVVSEMDGVAEQLIRDGQEGVIVRSQDPHEWAAHITELLSAPDRLRQMGALSRSRVLARASMDVTLDHYAHFFRQIARRPA